MINSKELELLIKDSTVEYLEAEILANLIWGTHMSEEEKVESTAPKCPHCEEQMDWILASILKQRARTETWTWNNEGEFYEEHFDKDNEKVLGYSCYFCGEKIPKKMVKTGEPETITLGEK